MKLDTSHVSIADKLQDLIEAKADMKAALQEKGVTPTGGLSTYADAISKITDTLDCEVIYVPNGINFGIRTFYRYGESSGSIFSGNYTLPKQIAFDITDNPNFTITGSSIKNTAVITLENKKLMIVDF